MNESKDAARPEAGSSEARSPAGYLRALIAGQGGSISVERFMQEALYHPGFGYYAKRVKTVGRGGDFATTATLHPALGVAVAAWARSHRSEVSVHGRWHLIELGGGTGELAAGVLRALGWRRLGLRYHLVEISAGLRDQQRLRLGTGGRVRWHEDIGAALRVADGRALIFSNEFVDAFPCVQLVRENPAEAWREVRVTWPEGSEHPQETTGPWDGEGSEELGRQTSGSRQRVELHLAYRRWLETWVGQWRTGRMLTLDYGDVPPILYRRRPLGTLRAYCRHRCFVGAEVYRRFGWQDLTADVNFSDLRRWGDESGLKSVGLQTQRDFLQRGLSKRQAANFQADASFGFLVDPEGAGKAFKVLEQIRNQSSVAGPGSLPACLPAPGRFFLSPHSRQDDKVRA